MRFSRFLPAIAWLVLITVLLCLPGSTLPIHPLLAAIRMDKWVHIALFGILCFLFDRAIVQKDIRRDRQTRWFLLVSIAGTVYGIMMEFVQLHWVLNRSFESWDIVADGLGCLLAYFIGRRYLLREG